MDYVFISKVLDVAILAFLAAFTAEFVANIYKGKLPALHATATSIMCLVVTQIATSGIVLGRFGETIIITTAIGGGTNDILLGFVEGAVFVLVFRLIIDPKISKEKKLLMIQSLKGIHDN